MGATYGIFSYVFPVETYTYYATAFAVFPVIWLPFGLRHRKAMIRFVLLTGYAKEKAWGDELQSSHESRASICRQR
jgi:hypothetical protein